VRPRVPAAVRVLAAASVLLVLPWATLPLARTVRRSAIEAQQRALAGTARRVAAALSDRPALFPPDDPVGAGGVVRLLELAQPVVADGAAADWADAAVEVLALPEAPDDEAAPPPFSAAVRLGVRGGGVYALVEVRDPLVALRDDATGAPGDRIEIAVVTADDEMLRFELDAAGDGPVSAWLVRDDGARRPDNSIEGAWRTAEGGYVVELRLPRTLVGARLGLAVVDVGDARSGRAAARLETGGMDSRASLAAVVAPLPATSAVLAGLADAGTRVWLVDGGKHVLAQAGAVDAADLRTVALPARLVLRALGPLARSLAPDATADTATAAAPRSGGNEVERALGGEPTGRWREADGAVVVSAAHPVRLEGRVRGAVLVEERGRDAWAADGGRRARRLAFFLAAALAGTGALLAFAARLSFRLRRLSGAVERLAEDPRVPASSLPDGTAGDEIGELSRGVAALAGRQREHAAYLEQVGRRLSHEMRTPVGVVRTSLDNLRLTGVPEAARVYLDRADDGLRRLSVILSRLSEATRLEQALAATERETYDLVPVVRGCVDGYRATDPGREILSRVPDGPLRVTGSPELVAQLLDKLVDNALGFARPGTAVEVDLARYGRAVALSVRNEGPPLPAEMEGRLFESMVSIRPATAAEASPHLGLGLYIVRLVAEFHGGAAAAHDRPDGRGVIVTVTLPLSEGPISARP
jgi:dedicated sortase system histidine kinase